MQYRNKPVKKVIIVSRKSDLEPDMNEELKTIGITDIKFSTNLEFRWMNFFTKDF